MSSRGRLLGKCDGDAVGTPMRKESRRGEGAACASSARRARGSLLPIRIPARGGRRLRFVCAEGPRQPSPHSPVPIPRRDCETGRTTPVRRSVLEAGPELVRARKLGGPRPGAGAFEPDNSSRFEPVRRKSRIIRSPFAICSEGTSGCHVTRGAVFRMEAAPSEALPQVLRGPDHGGSTPTRRRPDALVALRTDRRRTLRHRM
jgi:hypothetical protein